MKSEQAKEFNIILYIYTNINNQVNAWVTEVYLRTSLFNSYFSLTALTKHVLADGARVETSVDLKPLLY